MIDSTNSQGTICVALYSLNVGGSEKLGLGLIRSYLDNNYRVVCCGTRMAEGPLAETLRKWQVPYVALALDARTRIDRYLRKRRLKTWLLEHRVDLIHAHHFSVFADVYGAGRRAGVLNQIVTEHTADVVVNDPSYRRVVASMAPKATHVIAINDGVRDAIREVAGAANISISVIENGIDTVRFSPKESKSSDSDVDVVWLGRLHPDKDIMTGLRAFKIALELANTTLHLRVVGGGEHERAAKDYVERNALSQHVSFVGEVSNVADFLKRSDIFFMSSRTEGTPLALLEAMSCGLPVVATRVGGIPGTTSSECADLSAAGDAKGLGESLASLADAPEKREAMGASSREIVLKNYSDDLMVSKYLDVLKMVKGTTCAQ